jgi:hypothetical protein
VPILSVVSGSCITLCGPRDGTNRYYDSKELNLTEFLPNYLKEQEVYELTEFLQDFMNNLYDQYIYTTSAIDLELSAREVNKISILEKINRLTELHDPNYIDPEYIQFFANNLGYNVDIQRGELGVAVDQDSEDLCVQEDVKRYLRTIVSELPNWYKIKTTDNAIKTMLYSFGLVGDLIIRFTSDYAADTGQNWWNFRPGQDSMSLIPDGFYPTPHFAIRIDLDRSSNDYSQNDGTRNAVLKAVESIRPVNNVLDGVMATTIAYQNLFVRNTGTMSMYFRLS